MNDVTCVYQGRALLGECPVWNERDHGLYWTDIYKPSINRFDPASATNTVWDMPESVGSFAFRQQGGLIAGTRTGFAFIDLEAWTFEKLANPLPDDPEIRMNDGKCDPQGRFWVGSMIESLDQPVGVLYRYDPDGTWHEVVRDLYCPNGLAFSPDGATMYRPDSRRDTIWASDYDAATGTFSNERAFVQTQLTEGRPDGAAVDAEGYYWIANVQGWRVTRYTPEGIVDRVIAVPAQRPTMCAFGGPDLKTPLHHHRHLSAGGQVSEEAAAGGRAVRRRPRREGPARPSLRRLARDLAGAVLGA